MRNAFPGAVPEIPVSDINKATAYYESSLGFKHRLGLRAVGMLEKTISSMERLLWIYSYWWRILHNESTISRQTAL